MQVRVTPRKKAAAQKEPKKKAPKNRPDYPSTNVSSPVRGAPKRSIKSYAFNPDDDEGHRGAALQPPRGKSRVRYDDFVMPDDDDDDDYNDFAPVREAKTPRRQPNQKAHSAPITVDERLSGLDDLQKDILRDYMTGAKNAIQDLKFKKGLKFAPFSDVILREMGLNLPVNTEEMLAIPGIDPEKVKLYGKRFLILIKNTRELFESAGCLPVPRPLLQRAPVEEDEGDEEYEEYEDDDDYEERPADPNHRIEIDLLGESDGDGEGRVQAHAENESVASMGDYEEDDDDELHTSHHFNHPVNPEVEAFNRRFSQAEAARPNPRPKASSVARPAVPRAGSSRPPHKKKNFRKRSSGGGGDTYAGVKKRGASKALGAKRTGGSGGSRRTPSNGGGNRRSGGGAGGGGGWSGIMAMPTM
jgi:bloom syndrome protein